MPEDIILRSTPEKAGARRFANSENITPKADTDAPDIPRTSVKMDISNPNPAQVIPSSHPLDEHFSHTKSRPYPKHFGAGIHKSLMEQ